MTSQANKPFELRRAIKREVDRDFCGQVTARADRTVARSLSSHDPIRASRRLLRPAGLDYIATRIAPKFCVSSEVIARRLRVETLWPPAEQQSC